MMPPEGQNKAEEILQRYAKERRQRGGEFSLHPATRRLLQAEVAQVFRARRRERPAWLVWLGTWQGRFAMGGACAAVLVTAFAFWMNSNRRPGLELASATTAGAGDRRLAGREQFGRPFSESESLKAESAPPTKRTDEVVMLADQDAAGARSLFLAAQPAAAPQPAVPPVEQFGAVASYYSVVAPTNATDAYTLSLQPVAGTKNGPVPALPETATNALAFGIQSAQTFNYSASGIAGAAPIVAAKSAENDFTKLGRDLAAVQNVPAPQMPARDALKREALAETLAMKPADATLGAGAQAVQEKLVRDEPAAVVPPASAPVLGPAESATFAGGALAESPQVLWRRSDAAEQPVRFYRAAAPRLALAEESDSRAKQNAPAFRVLDRFAVEQRTNTMRLVDSDGSIYEGTLEPQATATSASPEPLDGLVREQRRTRTSLESAARPPAAYTFRASGSNVTLRQRIEVTGRLSYDAAATNSAGTALSTRQRVAPSAPRATPSRTPPATPTVIDGTVRVGAEGEQRFRALRDTR